MKSTSWIRLSLVAAGCALAAGPAHAAKPAVETAQFIPSITTSAPPFNASFVAANILDQNNQTEYASQSQGVNTFIDFDFGVPVPVTHFYHHGRTAADGITTSNLIFSNDPAFATSTTVGITHTSQVAPVTYAIAPQSARYVRWDVTGISGSATNQGGKEISFLNLTGRYAQIADPVITAAATQYNASFPPTNVFDNNPATDYASQSLGAATFMDFDFGAIKRVSGFELDNRSGHPLDAIVGSELHFSNDPTFSSGVSIVPVSHVIQEGAIIYSFPDQMARYVRWDITAVKPGGVAGNQGAAEIGFYAKVADGDFAVPAPTVMNSSTPFNAQYVAQNLFDNNPATEFASQSIGVGTFVEMDFGAKYNFTSVEHIDRVPFIDQITSAKLIFSDDAVFDASDIDIAYDQNSAAFETFLATVRARYVRWEITGITAGNVLNVGGKELQFYATPVPEPGSMALCGLGAAGLALVATRRRRATKA